MDESIRQILTVFYEEQRDATPRMAAALVRAQDSDSAEERREQMAEVYRYVHGMKGNAATMGLSDLVQVAHAMETALQPFRGGQRMTAPLAQKLLAAQDLLLERLKALAGGETPEESPELSRAAADLLAQAPQATPEKAESAAPAAAASPSGKERSARSGADETVRISAARLAAVEGLVNELREIRAALEHRAGEARRILWALNALATGTPTAEAVKACCHLLQAHQRGLTSDVGEMSDRLTTIDDELRRVRMLPLETVLSPLARWAWEHAQSVGKRVKLEISGAQVALDRRVLEALKDPLVHLVRNAVDHGVEPPEVRQAAGKHPQGVIHVTVEQRGAKVLLSLHDDGGGIDLDRVRAKAVERGLVSKEAAPALSEAALYEFLFATGFSTASEVTQTSGRGVGLDAVRENVHAIGGRVHLRSTKGRGTEFLLELPLSLATTEAVVFECAGYVLALPLAAVVSSHYVSGADGSAQTLDLAGELLPVYFLPQLINPASASATGNNFPLIVIRSADRMLALRVDRLLGSREVVVRPIPPELARLRHLSGAATLGDGKLIFLLNPSRLVELARGQPSRPSTERVRERLRVLVADDSITTRSLHRQVLEAAGFEVTTASDGEEALRLFQERGADLIVSDINMPRLDGLGLTRAVRQQAKNGRVPVILISSLDTEADLRRADEAGASAYLTKASYQRGELLKLVRQFLPV